MSISLSIPAGDPDLFRHKATNEVLLFLANHRYSQFSLRAVAGQITPSQQTVRRTLEVLITNGLVIESPTGNKRLVQINRDRLTVPDDPILRIPESTFHEPVEAAVAELTAALEEVLGIVLYGSVARGETDRRSDIDLWVLVREERGANQREANVVARALEEERFDGDRSTYDIDVEAVGAVPTYTEDVREIVVSGIPVYTTEDFETVERLLLEEVNA